MQPLYADLALGGFAIAHNGNLTSAVAIRDDLVGKGSLFQSSSIPVIMHLMAVSLKKMY